MVEKKPSKESRPPLFFLPSTPQKFACGFCLSGKAFFVVYELASLLQFIFCSITIQFVTTLAARYTKWLFMSFQDNLVKVEERKKCWRKPLKNLLQQLRWKTWFSLTTDEWSRLRLSIRMNKSQRISRGLHWKERRFRCQTTHKSFQRGRWTKVCSILLCVAVSIWWLSKKSIPSFRMDSEHASACAILPMHISHVVPQKYGQVGGHWAGHFSMLQILCCCTM